ncbi:FitA-like ribbon-helix-helix domain-containing protein [Nocardioides speluncae]|uniref:FitA-like ribbon-helix-helix domain-containing protein n=1 Tax=Nocardioides speluncae TaxID=2670337 RepID=UPI000D68DA4F
MGSIIQVRDVPDDVLHLLRERASDRGVSLSSYVRDLLTDDARQPTLDEAVKRIAARPAVELTDDEIVTAVHEGRR